LNIDHKCETNITIGKHKKGTNFRGKLLKMNQKYLALFLNKFYHLKGGSERVFFEEIKMLERHGHKCVPFSRRSPQDLPSEYSKYFAPPLPLDQGMSLRALKSAAEIIYSFEVKKYLGKLLSVVKPDIAHCHNIYGLLTSSVIDELYSREIPVIMSLHDYKIICPNYQLMNGSRICEDCKKHRYYKSIQFRCVQGSVPNSCIYALENYYNFITSKFHKKVSRFIAVSRFIKQKFIEFGFSPDQIDFIPNFIDTQKYKPSYRYDKYFLYMGRLSREKGVHTLLKAFRKLNRKDYKLMVAGDGPLKSELQGEKHRNGIDDNVNITGYLSGKALADAISNCACVVVPSEWYENCPMSILEALAYGKPVIGSGIGGIPELIEDETDGKIFECGNVEDLAAKMDQIAKLNSSELEEMGRSGRKKIEEHYNAEHHYQSLISLYKEILTER
jgi:glycosyltransferase involved in cell wall biosynthesis